MLLTRRQGARTILAALIQVMTGSTRLSLFENKPTHVYIPLEQWDEFDIEYKGEKITITMDELFNSLRGDK